MNNLKIQIISKILRILGSFISVIIYTRALSYGEFANFSYILAISSILFPISLFGIYSFAAHDFGDADDKSAIMNRALVFIVIIQIPVLFFWLSIYAWHNGDSIVQKLIIIFMIGSIFSVYPLFEAYFFSVGNVKPMIYATFISTIMCTSLRFSLFFIEDKVIAASILFIFEILILFFVLYFACRRELAIFKDIKIRFFDFKTLFVRAFPNMLSVVCVVLYMKSDIIMLRYLSNLKEVAIYSFAARLSEISYFIPVLVADYVFPKLYKKYYRNSKAYNFGLLSLVSLVIKAAILIVIITFLIGEFVVILIGGEKYIEAAYILKIHLLSLVFVYFGTIVGKHLIAKNLYWISFRNVAFAVLLNLLLNYLLIPLYGGLGAALATVISYSVGSWLMLAASPSTKDSFLLPFVALGFSHLRAYRFLKRFK